MELKAKKFNGRKIAEARELHGLSALYVAGEARITRQSLSYYETGKQVPSPAILDALARVLKVKWGFFMEPDSPSSTNPTFFRSLAAATSTARQTADRKLDFYESVVQALSKRATFPNLNLPDFGISSPETLTHEQVEDFAYQCRDFWNLGMGGIKNLTSFLELQGVIIVSSEEESGAIDAYSRWSKVDNRPYVHLCTNKHSAVRSRFDLAHELAHIVLHSSIDKTKFSYTHHFKHLETQADWFAGAFLLPAESFASHLIKPSLAYLRELKSEWLVSIGAMIMRAYQIGLIDEVQKQNLWISYVRHGWRRKEPLDDILRPEEPALIRILLEQFVASGKLQPKYFFDALNYESMYVAKQLGLEETLILGDPSNSAEVLREQSVTGRFRREGNVLIPTTE